MGNVGSKDYCRNDFVEIRMSDDLTHKLSNYEDANEETVETPKRSYYCVVESNKSSWLQNNTIEGIKCADSIINELEETIDFYTKSIQYKLKRLAKDHCCKLIENEILKCYNECKCNDLKCDKLESFDKCIKEKTDKIL